jgi:flagella basal body P-ring formation protein FlgA
MIRALAILLLAVCAAAGACITVQSDRILARDLAAAMPEFAAIPSDAVVGLAPAAGVRRTISPLELERIARRAGVTIGATGGACVERASEQLTEAVLRPALEAAIGRDDVRIEIVDFSRRRLPKGAIEFHASALPAPSAARPDAPVIWRGCLRYDGTRTATIWARVRISRQGSWVEATGPIGTKESVRPDQLVVKSGRVYGLSTNRISSVEEVAGHRLKRSVRAGEPITGDVIAERREVEPGDIVGVSVSSGSASLRFTARAESGGALHDKIYIAGPIGGKRLKAVIVAKDKVEIDADW